MKTLCGILAITIVILLLLIWDIHDSSGFQPNSDPALDLGIAFSHREVWTSNYHETWRIEYPNYPEDGQQCFVARWYQLCKPLPPGFTFEEPKPRPALPDVPAMTETQTEIEL